MGAAETKGSQFKWVDKYELIDIDDNDHLLKIMSRAGQSQYLGKQITCYSQGKIDQMEQMIDKKMLQPCPYLMKLAKVGQKKETNNCQQSKIFCMVFEKPYKTLKEDSIFRKINNDPYNAKDIQCILQSVVRALFYLRQIKQYHTKISASNIYINEDQTVVLGDPWLLNQQNDYNQTMHGIIYPSPEKILHKNGYISQPDLFLSDLFSLGITLLEMYYIEHMDIIYEKGYRRIIQTRLIEKISNINTQSLRKKMKIILSNEPLKRSQILKEYSLIDSRAETFINSQKQMFKKQYLKNMLVTSQVKTVKMSRKQYSVRQRRFHTDRQQSDSDDTISGNRNVRIVNLDPPQQRYVAQYISRPSSRSYRNQQHLRRQPNYISPLPVNQNNNLTPQKQIQQIPRRESQHRTVFTFNKKSQDFEQNDNKSISSIAKQQSSFSKQYFQMDFFENGKQNDHIKYRKSQASKLSEGLMADSINTATVNNRMTEQKAMKSSNFKVLKRKSEPID